MNWVLVPIPIRVVVTFGGLALVILVVWYWDKIKGAVKDYRLYRAKRGWLIMDFLQLVEVFGLVKAVSIALFHAKWSKKDFKT